VTVAARRWPLFSRVEIANLLCAQRWFSGLPPGDIVKIATLANPRHYSIGEIIHCKLDPAVGLYGIVDGRVRISSRNAEGREAVFSFMGPGEWFGHIGLIDGLPRTHDICAIQDTVILCIAHSDFRRLLEENLILYKHFALKLCELARLAFETIDEGTLLSLEARLAKRLIMLADHCGIAHAAGVLINQHLPQHELASILNVTRQTVNKKLADWRARGWIAIHYGQIVIIERNELEQLFKEGAPHSTAPKRHGTNS
jgi:CRP/FNR family cyclic AMP-dependent transcriptional regulator